AAGGVSAAVAAGFEVEGVLDFALAAQLNLVAQDPPDLYFHTVDSPTPVPVTLAAADPATAPGVVAAFNALYANLTESIAVARALNTSIDRATGALQA